jgi:endonuclease/exonuclease/phosphatase family metal-dependent hydrolase
VSFIRRFVLGVVAAGLLAVASVAAEAPLKVMTFNIRYATAPDGENSWNKRKELLLSVVRKFDPDLLGTQETLASQADYLTANLSDHTLVGVGREDGKRGGEFSALLFRTGRFTMVDSGTFWLSETPDEPGSKGWDSSLPRIVSWARLKDRSDANREFYYLNTHWDHRGNQARIESGKLIRGWLTEHAAKKPIILTGDFNVNEDHEGYQALVSESGRGPRLTDVYRQVHPKPRAEESTFGNFTGNRRGKRIDFILATPDFTAGQATIVHTNDNGRYPSDHYPVTAVLTLQGKRDKQQGDTKD